MYGLHNMKTYLTLLQTLAGILVLWSLPTESVMGQSSDIPDNPNLSIGWGTGTFGAPIYVVGSGPHARVAFPNSQLILGYWWSVLGPDNAHSVISLRLRRDTETKWRLAGRPVSRYLSWNALAVDKLDPESGEDRTAILLYHYDIDQDSDRSYLNFDLSPSRILFLGVDYGYKWPVYQAGRLTINASVGASLNVALLGLFFSIFPVHDHQGLLYISVDGGLTMDFTIGRLH